MAYLYILFSDSCDKFYVGSTRDRPEDRLYKHNNQHKGFTSMASDWRIVYLEVFEVYALALEREKTIKAWKSRKLIEKLVATNLGSAHPGMTPDEISCIALKHHPVSEKIELNLIIVVFTTSIRRCDHISTRLSDIPHHHIYKTEILSPTQDNPEN